MNNKYDVIYKPFFLLVLVSILTTTCFSQQAVFVDKRDGEKYETIIIVNKRG
jgi:hypothetical protein